VAGRTPARGHRHGGPTVEAAGPDGPLSGPGRLSHEAPARPDHGADHGSDHHQPDSLTHEPSHSCPSGHPESWPTRWGPPPPPDVRRPWASVATDRAPLSGVGAGSRSPRSVVSLTSGPLFATMAGSCVCTCSSPTCFLPDGERHIALADTPPEPKGQGVSCWAHCLRLVPVDKERGARTRRDDAGWRARVGDDEERGRWP